MTRTPPQSIPVVPVFAHILSAYWLALAVWLMVFHLVLACRHRTIAERSCVQYQQLGRPAHSEPRGLQLPLSAQLSVAAPGKRSVVLFVVPEG